MTKTCYHDEFEYMIYVVDQETKKQWGSKLDCVVQTEVGHFIYAVPFVPHQKVLINSEQKYTCGFIQSYHRTTAIIIEIKAELVALDSLVQTEPYVSRVA